MNLSKLTSAFALTLAVSALPAMALNTTGVYNNSNYPCQSQGQHQGH